MKNRVRLDKGGLQSHRYGEQTWLAVGRGKREGAIGVGEQEVQAIRIREATGKIHKINYKDKLYNTGKIVSYNNYEWDRAFKIYESPHYTLIWNQLYLNLKRSAFNTCSYSLLMVFNYFLLFLLNRIFFSPYLKPKQKQTGFTLVSSMKILEGDDDYF